MSSLSVQIFLALLNIFYPFSALFFYLEYVKYFIYLYVCFLPYKLNEDIVFIQFEYCIFPTA